MKILNYREGFASNSSSTHSIYFHKKPVSTDIEYNECYNEFGFGWEPFILVEKYSIDQYIVAQIITNFMFKTGGDAEKSLVNALNYIIREFPELPVPDSDIESYKVYVDHQSLWEFPWDNKKKHPDTEFLKKLIDYIHNNNAVIVGGNDNEETDDEAYKSIRNKYEPIETPKEYKKLFFDI